MEQTRKKLQRQIKTRMKGKTGYSITKGVPNAPTPNSINNMLSKDNFNINTLLFTLNQLGGEIVIKWNS